MRVNPHFRVLALTATPGNNPEVVQQIINNLHLSVIEIRDEHSLDLRKYIFEKKTEIHIIELPDSHLSIRDKWAKAMNVLVSLDSMRKESDSNDRYTCNL